MIEKKAYAKINLFLDIESRREDGYHNIKSIMQTVNWFDIIRVDKSYYDGITITSDDRRVPTDSSNIVYRVAKAFLNELDCNDGISIDIEKHIPISAGMAGGSADGAATLEALNELYEFPFSVEELIRIGKNVGADIPFCIVGGTKLVSGIGDVIEDCEALHECHIVCAKMSNEGVSTPMAYKELDNIYCDFVGYNYSKNKLNNMITAIKNQDTKGLCSFMFNIFEEAIAVEHASVNQIKSIMSKYSPLKTMMSGSGPSVFGVFEDIESADKACLDLKKHGAAAKVCVPICK
jgi:4-diphosphocytidyl-2-C-methyl-D-erythritol kinase